MGIFPKVRGENKGIFELPPPSFERNLTTQNGRGQPHPHDRRQLSSSFKVSIPMITTASVLTSQAIAQKNTETQNKRLQLSTWNSVNYNIF